jgi:DNA-binding transcriptional MerR regulator/methylmalonyl-CoA mutase cobalamin-binding subunit
MSQQNTEQPFFSIRVAARLSGLRSDTIRKWEQRHAAVQPQRSSGNARRYSAADVQRLRLLNELVTRGHPIRELGQLDEQQLTQLAQVEGLQPDTNDRRLLRVDLEALVSDYINAIVRFDERRASELLTRAASVLGPLDFALGLVRPALQEIGLRWQHKSASIAHEHLVSAQVRGLLSMGLGWMPSPSLAKRIVVSTPSGHTHEFGALVGALIARARGFEVTYLGPDLPLDDIRLAMSKLDADVCVLSIVREVRAEELAPLLHYLRGLSSEHSVWLGLPIGHALTNTETGARLFHGYESYDLALAELATHSRF